MLKNVQGWCKSDEVFGCFFVNLFCLQILNCEVIVNLPKNRFNDTLKIRREWKGVMQKIIYDFVLEVDPSTRQSESIMLITCITAF